MGGRPERVDITPIDEKYKSQTTEEIRKGVRHFVTGVLAGLGGLRDRPQIIHNYVMVELDGVVVSKQLRRHLHEGITRDSDNNINS